jgi:predicted nucleic acid-binding protein
MSKPFSIRVLRVYADTSVFGGVLDLEFAAASAKFLDQVKSDKFRLVISAVVEAEMAKAPPRVQAIFQSVAPWHELVTTSAAVVQLQKAYLQAGILPPLHAADAMHVAHATVWGCQMIVSWNFRHIVHYRKIPLYNAINVREGYFPIGIHTPQEVIEYEKEKV